MSRSTEDQNGASVDPLLGRLLDGRYRLESLVGRGGMGSVYRALDVRLDRPVAVKALRDPDGANEERFTAEVRTLARFAHPNLVRLLDAGELDGRPYLVMELIEGETLARRIARGALSDRETARIGAGVAAALAYVHQQGIVHRDVKPANVLLDERGDARLADFGIARLVDTTGMTATGFTLGTPAYLAPEQVQGTVIGPPADVYALGLVLLECLTGRRAFEGTASEITAARLQRDPVIPSEIDVPWRVTLASMTQRLPADRLPAAQVASVLSARAHTGGLASPSVDEEMSTADATVLLPRSGVADTVRLDPTMTAVAATEVVPSKVVQVAATGPLGFVRALGRRAAAGALGIVILVLFVGLLLGGVFSSTPRKDAPASTSSTSASSTSTSSTTSSTSTTTTTLAPLSVASAGASVVAALTAGATNGTVMPAAGQQLDNQLQPLLFSAQPTPATQQVQQFDQLVQSFDQDVANGQITGRSARLLRRAINSLAVALGTTVPTATTMPPPTTPTPPGHGGPGRGKGHGKGH